MLNLQCNTRVNTKSLVKNPVLKWVNTKLWCNTKLTLSFAKEKEVNINKHIINGNANRQHRQEPNCRRESAEIVQKDCQARKLNMRMPWIVIDGRSR